MVIDVGGGAVSVTRELELDEEVRVMEEGSVMALVPLRFSSVSETFCTSISWHLQH